MLKHKVLTFRFVGSAEYWRGKCLIFGWIVRLEELVKPERVQMANVDIVDIAGLEKGASKGEGLGNQFLANIRECNAIIHVLRCFDNDNIVHVDGNVNPIRDKETIDIELQSKDLETVEKTFRESKSCC